MPCRCRPVEALDGLSDHRGISAIHAEQSKIVHEEPKAFQKRFWEDAPTEEIVSVVRKNLRAMLNSGVGRKRKEGNDGAETRSAAEMLKRDCEEEMRNKGVGLHYELDDWMEAWDEAWGGVKEQLVPRKRVKVKPRRRSARWFTQEIKEDIQKRTEKEREACEKEGPEHERAVMELKEIAKRVRKGIIKAKRDFFHQKLAELPKGRITDRKEGWKLWNSVTGRKRKSNAQPGCSADKCGEAFLHKIERIREPLLSHPLRVPTRRNIPFMSESMEVTEREVREAIERDKGTKSVGVDEIPMSILKR
eukprot:gene17904-biopygen35177